jgi:CRISPR-associated endoribonuclease Cas6/Csy4 subtype I-F
MPGTTMTLRYFVDFDCRGMDCLLSEDDDGNEFLVTHIVTGIHLAIVTECGDKATRQDKIALSFPNARDQKHGSIVRVLTSDQEVMGRLLRNPAIHRFATGIASEMQPVPEQHTFQLVLRNRKPDRTSPSRLRRDIKRGKESKSVNRIKTDGFIVKVKSKTTNLEFPLFISQKKVDLAATGFFNAYGLSGAGTIPSF